MECLLDVMTSCEGFPDASNSVRCLLLSLDLSKVFKKETILFILEITQNIKMSQPSDLERVMFWTKVKQFLNIKVSHK